MYDIDKVLIFGPLLWDDVKYGRREVVVYSCWKNCDFSAFGYCSCSVSAITIKLVVHCDVINSLRLLFERNNRDPPKTICTKLKTSVA